MANARRLATACTWMVLACLVKPVLAQDARGPETDRDRQLTLPSGRVAGQSGTFWTSAIGNGGPAPLAERLLIVTEDGRVLDRIDGDENRVVMPARLTPLLLSSDSFVTLVHNHPGSTSLSGQDLDQLGKPGVSRVVAVGNDGSVYEAAPDRRFDAARFIGDVYPSVLNAVIEAVTDGAVRLHVDVSRAYLYVTHVVALILHQAHVIEYRSSMSAPRAVDYERDHDLYARIIKTETARLDALFSHQR